MREHDAEKRQGPVGSGGPSPQSPAAPATGGRLHRAAAHQGDHAEQEGVLSPAAELLAPAQVDEALAYNGKRTRGQGTPWVKALQEFLGVAQTGAYDDATVVGVAGFQDEASGLRVDGKVGPKTEGVLRGKVKPAAPPAPAPAAAPAAAPVPSAAPVPAAPAPTPAAPQAEAVPQATKAPTVADAAADAEAVPPDVATLVAALGDGLLPLVFLTPERLSLGTLPSWAAARAETFRAATTALATLPEGADKTTLSAALMTAANTVASLVQSQGAAVRDHAIKLVNDASVLKAGAVQPELPSQADVRAYQAALKSLGDTAAAPALAASALVAAVPVAQDGALALFQGLSVLSARATWKKGVVEPGAGGVAAANKDPDNALKGIFQDAGWGNITTTTYEKKKKDGTTETVTKVADWCGMFVGSALYRGGGLDEELRAGMLHTSNVLDYFQYTQAANAGRAPKSIWADGAWHDLKTYHGARGSLRRWTTRAAVTAAMEGDGALDIRPGDVVLIDHSGKAKSPQHITMVESYDPATRILRTIEGNTGGIQAADKKVSAKDGTTAWAEHHGADGSGVHERDLTNMSKKSREAQSTQYETNRAAAAARPSGAHRGAAGSTVFGVGRPSVVDFEEHSYAKLAVPDDMRTKSPEEMMALAKKKSKDGARAKKAGVKAPQ